MKLPVTFLVFIVLVFSCSKQKEELYPINYGEKWGLIDKSGKIVVEPTIPFVRYFPPLLPGYGEEIIDSLYKLIESPNYCYYDQRLHWENRQSIYKDSFPYGVMIYHHTWGLAKIVMPGRHSRSGFIDLKGKLKVGFVYDNVNPFHDAVAAVKMTGGDSAKWGFIDTTGKMIIDPKFNEVRFPGFVSDLAYVYEDSIHGYIDKSGNYIWYDDYSLYDSPSDDQKNMK